MLDLAAGEAALKKCGVDSVAGFLHEAVKLSKYVDWEESYDVVLQVYTLSAEVESSRGNFVRSSELVDIILEKVKLVKNVSYDFAKVFWIDTSELFINNSQNVSDPIQIN